MTIGFKYKFIVLLGVLLGQVLFASEAMASTSSSTIYVEFTVPAGGGPVSCTTCEVPTDNPPSITNVTFSTTCNSAAVNWSATDDKGINGIAFFYGLTDYANSETISGNYQVSLSGLEASTAYQYKISVTDTASHTASYEGTFNTPSCDTDPVSDPPVISNVQVSKTQTSATVNWSTNKPADSRVNYGLSSDYTLFVYESVLTSEHSLSIPNLNPNTTYHYSIVSTAGVESDITADAIFTTNASAEPPADVSNLAISNNNNSFTLTWTNPGDLDFSGVKVLRKVGSRSNNPTDGNLVYNGGAQSLTDSSVSLNTTYYYTVFSFNSSGQFSGGAFVNGSITAVIQNSEICGNGIDDDFNGFADCADSACSGAQNCVSSTSTITETQINKTEYSPPAGTVTGENKLNLSDLNFSIGNRQINILPQGGQIASLPGAQFTVSIKQSDFLKNPESLILNIDGTSKHQFSLNGATYFADISFPAGNHMAYVEVDYGMGITDNVGFKTVSLPWGKVTSGGQAVFGAKVTLYSENGQAFNTAQFGFLNPAVTRPDGSFGWQVANGSYYVTVEKEGFYKRTTAPIVVTNNTVARSIELIEVPPKLIDEIDPDKTILENADIVIGNLKKQAKAAAQRSIQKIGDIKDNPEVQKATSRVVAPVVVGAAAVGTFSLISFANLLPFLRLLFLQPLMLLGLRRRKGWGQVYNALSKLPVDLATVRLFDENGKLLQTKVTDRSGRYAFIVNPGTYKIVAAKGTMVFPSSLLSGIKDDGRRPDVYHGETITVAEKDAVITANIPLDPIGDVKKPVRLFWYKMGRSLQIILSWVGIAVTALSLYISPKWYVWALLGVHFFLFIVFRRLAIPPKIKSWGIVYDDVTKKPVAKAVARLFNSQYNKLVSTQITDHKGRYYFMAGDNPYYVTYDHDTYHQHKSEIIDLSGKEAENIAVDVGLKKSDAGNNLGNEAELKSDTDTPAETAPAPDSKTGKIDTGINS